MKKANVLIALLMLFYCLSSGTQAQEISPTKAKGEITKIFNSYRVDGLLRLTIYSSLYYSDKPSVKIDSTIGSYYIQGENVFGNINNSTTYLQNAKWAVCVRNDVREMYIDSFRADKDNPTANPLQIIDSLSFDSTATYSLSDHGPDAAVLKAVYPPGGEVVESILTYKKSTHRIISARYKMPVNEEDFTGLGLSHTATVSRFYILKMAFTEAWPDEPSQSLFSEAKFFRFNGTNVFPSEKYKAYNIITTFNLPGNIDE